jgi:hypothetical protein
MAPVFGPTGNGVLPALGDGKNFPLHVTAHDCARLQFLSEEFVDDVSRKSSLSANEILQTVTSRALLSIIIAFSD